MGVSKPRGRTGGHYSAILFETIPALLRQIFSVIPILSSYSCPVLLGVTKVRIRQLHNPVETKSLHYRLDLR